jgi:hypothetical protein
LFLVYTELLLILTIDYVGTSFVGGVPSLNSHRAYRQAVGTNAGIETLVTTTLYGQQTFKKILTQ